MRRLIAAALSALALLTFVTIPALGQDAPPFSAKSRVVIGGSATTLDTAITAVRGVTRSPYRLAVIGDSQTARNHSVSSTQIWSLWTGYGVWLNALSGGKFRFTQADNYGVVGDRIPQFTARIPAVIASDAGTVIYHGGTNDALYWALYGPTSGTGVAPASYLADTIATMRADVGRLLDAGMLVVLMPPQQRTQSAWTANFGLTTAQVPYARRFTVAIAEAMKDFARSRKGIIFSDPTALIMDPTGGSGPNTPILTDGTHYAQQAGYLIGNDINGNTAPFIPNFGSVGAVDANDQWATDLVRGNLFLNPLMIGSTSTVSTAPLGGVTVSGWGAQVSNAGTIASGTATLSVVTRPDGLGFGIRLVVANLKGTSNSVSLGIGQTIAVDEAKLATGDIVSGRVFVTQAAGQVGINNIGTRIAESDGSGTSVDIYGGAGAAPFFWPSIAFPKFAIETPTFPIRPSGGGGSRNVNARHYVVLDTTGTNGASCDVIFWSPVLRKQ